jgi:hypothetical protein
MINFTAPDEDQKTNICISFPGAEYPGAAPAADCRLAFFQYNDGRNRSFGKSG